MGQVNERWRFSASEEGKIGDGSLTEFEWVSMMYLFLLLVPDGATWMEPSGRARSRFLFLKAGPLCGWGNIALDPLNNMAMARNIWFLRAACQQ